MKKVNIMKKLLKATIVLAAIFTIGSMQVFATGSNATPSTETQAYLAKANVIRAEIDAYTTQIKEMNEYNSSVNQKVKALNEQYKANKDSATSEKLKNIKELRKSIKTTGQKEKTVREDNAIKSLVQNKEYDKALERLNEILEAKKEQLKVVQERNAIWRQIDAIIG